MNYYVDIVYDEDFGCLVSIRDEPDGEILAVGMDPATPRRKPTT